MGKRNDPPVDRETLCVHIDLLGRATRDDLDELLTDLLARVYASLAAQNG